MRQPPSIRVSQFVSSASALPPAPRARLEPSPGATRNRSLKLGASRSFFPTEHYGARQIASPRSTAKCFATLPSGVERHSLAPATEPERDRERATHSNAAAPAFCNRTTQEESAASHSDFRPWELFVVRKTSLIFFPEYSDERSERHSLLLLDKLHSYAQLKNHGGGPKKPPPSITSPTNVRGKSRSFLGASMFYHAAAAFSLPFSSLSLLSL